MTPWQLASTSEQSQQRALFCWANCAAQHGMDYAADARSYKQDTRDAVTQDMKQANFMPRLPLTELAFMFAIPNGGKRDKITAGNLKAEGVKAGVPDIFLPVMYGPTQDSPHGGLFIEMKKPASKPKHTGKGGVRATQTEYHRFLEEQGYAVVVCYSWEEARDAIIAYLYGA